MYIGDKKAILAVVTFAVLLVLGDPAQAAGKRRKNECAQTQNVVEKPTEPSIVAFDETVPHEARLIGEELSSQNLRQHLDYLTGVLPIDEKGAIPDRSSLPNRVRARNYLANQLTSLGYEITIEAQTGGVHENGEPINLQTASINDLRYYRKSRHFKYVMDVLVALKGWAPNKPSALRGITEEDLKQIIAWPERLPEVSGIRRGLSNIISLVTGTDAPTDQQNAPKFLFSGEEVNLDNIGIFSNRNLESVQYQAKDLLARIATSNEPVSNLPDIGSPLVNIIADIKGSEFPDEIILLTAHYDTAGTNVPGADDNGSGVVTLLEIARLLKQFPPKRTVRIVFTDLEERGMQGSSFNSRNLEKANENVLGVLVMDMFGYAPLHPDGAPPVFVVEIGQEYRAYNSQVWEKTRNLGEIFARQFYRYNDRTVRLSVETEQAKPWTTDLGPYLDKGFAGFLLSAPYEGCLVTPGYHTPGDIICQMNWLYFHEIAQLAVESLARTVGMSLPESYSINPETTAHLDSTSASVSEEKLLKAISDKFPGGRYR